VIIAFLQLPNAEALASNAMMAGEITTEARVRSTLLARPPADKPEMAAVQNDTPIPLPRHCDGVTPPGMSDPCCVFGYVYFRNQAVLSATVYVTGPYGSRAIQTAPGPASDTPYYRFDLSSSPISATVGSWVTITTSYNGMVSSRAWRVQPNGQQVDLGLVPDSGAEVIASLGWATLSSLPVPRDSAAAVALDGRVYVIGGANNAGALSSTLVYDPVANSWSSRASMPGVKSGPGVAIAGGRIYVMGSPDAQLYEYDPVSDTWAIKAALPVTPTDRVAVASISGQIFVAFNVAGDGHPQLYHYDPFQNTWTQRQSHPDNRSISSLGVANGMIYAVGGGLQGQTPQEMNRVDRYDPFQDVWTIDATPRLTTRRTHLGPTLPTIDGKLYVIGGWDGFTQLDSVEVYDPWSNTWSAELPMPTARYKAAYAAIGHQLFVIGGNQGGASTNWLTVNERLAWPERLQMQNPIAFISDQSGSFELFTANPDGSHRQRLTNDTFAKWVPAWSSVNKRLSVAVSRVSDFDIYTFDEQGQDWRRVTVDPRNEFKPTWSPQGDKIAFLREMSGGIQHVWTVDVHSGTEQQITFGPGTEEERPAWSPDGRKIAFTSNRDGNWQIYVVNAHDGSEMIRLTNMPGDGAHAPDWSPDGRKIAFFNEGDIYVMSPDGSNVQNLTRNGLANLTPQWSPDGRMIVFFSLRDGHAQVYRMTAEGDSQRNISNNAYNEWAPAWGTYAPLLLYGGGTTASQKLGDMWRYDGTEWIPVNWAGQSPPAREAHSMAFDQRRGRVIVFGGSGLTQTLSDTWEFTGAAWARIDTAHSPSARYEAGLVYDTRRDVTVLYGGTPGSYIFYTDTWEYDGHDWHTVNTAHHPPGSIASVMAYDEARGKTVLVTDWQAPGFGWVNETWEYDGSDWRFVTQAPSWRYLIALAYDRTRQRIVLFGGYEHGGMGCGLADTWEYDGQTWVQVSTPNVPPGRCNQMMAYEQSHHQIFMFGGSAEASGFLSDTWAYNGLNWTPIMVSHRPTQRHAAGLVEALRTPQVPVAVFTATPRSGHAPLNVQFIDQSVGAVSAWQWDFGDGIISGARYPTHTYDIASNYTVTLSVDGPDGQATEVQHDYISMLITAQFDASPKTGEPPLAVAFVDYSSGAIGSRLWNFGDGETSTAQNPTHTYVITGIYTVSLAITGPSGSDVITKPNLVVVTTSLPAYTWTFMLYLTGDNNLSPYFGDALDALERVAGNPNVNIVVLWDGWSANDTRLYDIEYNLVPGVNTQPITGVGWNSGELNTGDPQTLIDFVNWARTMYPAQHYLLAIANHGRGTSGIAWDNTSGNDYLSAVATWGGDRSELKQAFQAITDDGTRKIDVLYFDACLMGLIEDAYEVKDYVDFVVASENLGWSVFAYDSYVSSVTSSTTPRQLAQHIGDNYFGALPGFPATISALDMSQMTNLAAAVNDFAQALRAYISAATIPQLIALRNNTQVFDSRNYGILDPTNDEYIDLFHFADLVGTTITNTGLQSTAQVLKAAIANVVVAEHHRSATDVWSGNYWDLSGAHGVAIYFPPRSGGWDYIDYVAGDQWEFTRQTAWDQFLLKYFQISGLPWEPPTYPGIPLMQPIRHYLYLPLLLKNH
jgi:PKD repeat protein/N-acetylneuraminic acid mutarotase